jgi:hypothetical protein
MEKSSLTQATPEGRLPTSNPEPDIELSRQGHGIGRAWSRLSSGTQLAFIALLTILVAAAADRVIAASIGFYDPGSDAAYRRIGPSTGPQVFVAGSSVLQFALSWQDISTLLGQGIENWGVPASSPDIWEVSQGLAANVNRTIIGISLYDLNEYHLADSRANIVSFTQTIRDLRESGASWQFSRRVLSQYPLAYVRKVFPTAANSDEVLVGIRGLLRERLGLASASEDRDRALVLPSEPVLEFGKVSTKLSDWPQGKLLRRLSLMRGDNRGAHLFNGPKQVALRRMLARAHQQGSVIIVVLPVSSDYLHEFITPKATEDFESTLMDAQRIVPDTTIVRLDRVPAFQSDEYFSDFVHLNSAGRAVATEAFMKQLTASAGQKVSEK